MMAQSPQAHWSSQGENGTTTLPHFRIYGAASCAPHLGWRLCSGGLGGCVSWDQLRIAAYLLLCLKLKTCGLRPTWRVFQPIVRVAFLRHTLYEPSHVSAKTRRLSTHNLGLAVLEWVKGLWSSQNHMPNSMQGSL